MILTAPSAAPWTATDNGLLVANADPFAAQLNNSPAAGTLYLMKLMPRAPVTLSKLLFILAGAGTGPSTGSFTGLYSLAGLLLTGSADIGTPLTSSDVATCSLSAAQQITPAGAWAALLVNMSVQPTLWRGLNDGSSENAGLTAATARFAVNGTGLSALPASINPASNDPTTSNCFWAGGK